MTTEYRRGIPSVAHVEAATRLGLLWHRRGRDAEHRTRFVVENGQVLSDYGEEGDQLLALGPVTNNERHYAYYCIRPDGTPVDWEVLDQEVARVGQPGRPRDFRADLLARISRHFSLIFRSHNQVSNLTEISSIDAVGVHSPSWQWGWGTADREAPTQQQRTDILARWTVYQELKPLYDLVDGTAATGRTEPLPIDVFQEWARDSQTAVLDTVAERRVAERMRGQTQATTVTSAPPEQHRHDWIYDGLGGGHNGQYYHNCACGERDWFAEPMSAPSPREVVVRPTSAQPIPRRFADVRPDRHGWRWWRVQGPGIANTAQIECSNHLGEVERQFRFRGSGFEPWTTFILDRWLDRTVIPIDEQGNPVSWESIVQGRNAVQTVAGRDVEEDRPRLAEQRIPAFMPSPGMAAAIEASQLNEQRLAENPELWREAQRQAASSPRTTEAIYQDLLARHRARMSGGATTFSNSFNQPLTYEGLEQVLRDMRAIDNASPKNPTGQPAQPAQPSPLPRFTADELDDVDHSATTTQDSATLKRGKLPTVEAIGKYREVMAKRNGTVAEAVKAAGIDCEIAQYVLERWADGLSDDQVPWFIVVAIGTGKLPAYVARNVVDERVETELRKRRPTLDTSEPADTTAQRQRAEAAERQARTAALQTQLAKERAACIAEPQEEPTRFSLLEVDEAADPARSIEAWKVQRAANERRARNTVHPVTAATPKPTLAPRRKPFEVVDVEADGLSGGTAFAVLLSRAMNQNC